MSKCDKLSNEWLFFFGILAAYAVLGLFLIVPVLLASLAGGLLLTVFVGILVIIIVLFALAIILKGLSRLFHFCKRY
ncbi:hypothetical protein SporoP37_12390 [Sporosarcina sp. P37]|uniref:hypothetical protein n=1 Tax=unclassified Sporosarcina TaxID=2647733 RepID=UPI0009BE3E8A|nr:MULTISPECIES: hypothetical protein [unclassified Sporosarcina]ARD48877.1 hypothetical protein SporoP33_12005 [Sporosarcina sp. P33]ARK25375.1 hypothetical protein SporoP37_12390 [Sporosarcina sp. P37]PID19071.1 hypothetical protein CSV62_05580 [Sporosarcina sp. P35]